MGIDAVRRWIAGGVDTSSYEDEGAVRELTDLLAVKSGADRSKLQTALEDRYLSVLEGAAIVTAYDWLQKTSGVTAAESPVIAAARRCRGLSYAAAQEFVGALLEQEEVCRAFLRNEVVSIADAISEVRREVGLTAGEVEAALRDYDRAMGNETREVIAARQVVARRERELAEAQSRLAELQGQ